MKQEKEESPRLFTIGYEGLDIELFVENLIAHDIKVLCDVRKNPISRRKGFSKNKLRAALESRGIEYLHFPQLGVPSEERRAAKMPKDRREMFERYTHVTIPRERDVIAELAAIVLQKKRVALTCVEGDAHDCHRSIVADAVRRVGNLIHPVEHL